MVLQQYIENFLSAQAGLPSSQAERVRIISHRNHELDEPSFRWCSSVSSLAFMTTHVLSTKQPTVCSRHNALSTTTTTGTWIPGIMAVKEYAVSWWTGSIVLGLLRYGRMIYLIPIWRSSWQVVTVFSQGPPRVGLQSCSAPKRPAGWLTNTDILSTDRWLL